MPHVHLVVPGDPATRTGGYIYDRRVLEGLDALGWRSDVHSIGSSFPTPTRAAIADARSTLARIPEGRAVVIDGLALGGLAPLLEAEAHRLRLVALVHHPLAEETGLDPAARETLRRAEQASLDLVERIVVTSAWTARALSANGVSPERIRVVEPGTDRVPESQRSLAGDSSAAELAAREDRRPTPLRLLCVATLTPRKGHRLLIDALAPLYDLPWRLDCVGSSTRDPATARALRRQLQALALERRVTLHGELPAAALLESYRRADAFVLASYLEGYGMALADAVAHGLPVVSTTAGAIPETVSPDASVLVPPGDRPALTGALKNVIEDGRLLRRLARNARSAADALPTWHETSVKFAAAIGDLADRPARSGAGAGAGA